MANAVTFFFSPYIYIRAYAFAIKKVIGLYLKHHLKSEHFIEKFRPKFKWKFEKTCLF